LRGGLVHVSGQRQRACGTQVTLERDARNLRRPGLAVAGAFRLVFTAGGRLARGSCRHLPLAPRDTGQQPQDWVYLPPRNGGVSTPNPQAAPD
jgi:hypothetical protein